MEHSPTPWKLDSMDAWEDELDAAVDAKGEPIIYFAEGIDEEIMADMHHIIRCVNAHDALVEACRAVTEDGPDVDEHGHETGGYLIQGAAYTAAQAALAQLE